MYDYLYLNSMKGGGEMIIDARCIDCAWYHRNGMDCDGNTGDVLSELGCYDEMIYDEEGR